MSGRVKKVMTQPIYLIYEFIQSKEKVLIWLYENTSMRMEGVVLGFDEYMNIVLDDAYEINTKTNNRKSVGRILLKGDCVTLIQKATPFKEEN